MPVHERPFGSATARRTDDHVQPETVFVVRSFADHVRLSWKLTLLLFVTMPLVSLTVKFFGQQVHTRFPHIQDFFAQITRASAREHNRVRVVRPTRRRTPRSKL